MNNSLIPYEWLSFELSDLLETILDFRGKTPKKIDMEWGNGEIIALSANNVEMGKINFEKETYYGSEELYNKWMNKGDCDFKDIIMTMEAPLGNIAQIPDNKKYILSQRVILLKLNNKIANQDYIKYFLMSEYFQSQLIKYSSGTTAKGIQQSKLIELEIFLPKSLLEQQKIASILENVDNNIYKTQEIIEKYEMMKQGLMHDLFTKGIDENGKHHTEFKDSELGEIPNMWEILELSKITSKITDGSHFSPQAKESEYMIANVKDMEYNHFNFKTCTKISLNDFEYLKATNCAPEINDVLLSKDGTIGRVIVYKSNQNIVLLSSIAIIRLKANDPDYLGHVLRSNYFEKQIFKLQSGSALKRIVLKDIQKLKFPFPKVIKEQIRIADILNSIDNKLNSEQKYLYKLQKLKTGLMQDLLTGNVRVKT